MGNFIERIKRKVIYKYSKHIFDNSFVLKVDPLIKEYVYFEGESKSKRNYKWIV